MCIHLYIVKLCQEYGKDIFVQVTCILDEKWHTNMTQHTELSEQGHHCASVTYDIIYIYTQQEQFATATTNKNEIF